MGFEFANYKTQQGFFLIWCNSHFYSLTPVLKRLKSLNRNNLKVWRASLSPVIPLDTSSANSLPYYLITNLWWLREGVVKLMHFELFSYTVLQGDERSVSFSLSLFFILYIGKIYVNLSYKEIGVLKGNPASCFSQGQATGFRCFHSGEKIITRPLWEAGPPVSVLLCYEYGTDGAKSICSVGTKTLTT